MAPVANSYQVFFAKGTAIVVIHFWKTNKKAGNIKHVCKIPVYRESNVFCM